MIILPKDCALIQSQSDQDQTHHRCNTFMHVTFKSSRLVHTMMTSPRLRQPTHLVLDYDCTLTVHDTMAVLGELPIAPKMSWRQITDAYMQDYALFKKQPYPWNRYDREEYSGWLASRKWVEDHSARRVQDACFFRGVRNEHVREAVSRSLQKGSLRLRDGWEKLIELFLPDYDQQAGTFTSSCVSILSVNWCETSIRQALWQAAGSLTHPEKDKLRHLINDMVIHANEIEGLGSPLGSSGRVCRALDHDIRTSRDKLRYLPTPRGQRDHSTPFVVYVGDSSTDFDSLCAADLGVWLCDVPESEYAQAFADAFKPLNFVPPPLTLFGRESERPALFYWAPDLFAVRAVLIDDGE